MATLQDVKDFFQEVISRWSSKKRKKSDFDQEFITRSERLKRLLYEEQGLFDVKSTSDPLTIEIGPKAEEELVALIDLINKEEGG